MVSGSGKQVFPATVLCTETKPDDVHASKIRIVDTSQQKTRNDGKPQKARNGAPTTSGFLAPKIQSKQAGEHKKPRRPVPLKTTPDRSRKADA